MGSLYEVSDALRRASQASSIKRASLFKKELSSKEPPPKDTLGLVNILFLLFGIATILPLTFFGSAFNYWMYKFRDIEADEVDLNNKTTLQTYFASGTIVANSIPGVVGTVLSIMFGHRAKMRSKIIWSLSSVACIFIFFTIMIEVNTDPWQTGFFIITLTGIGSICGFTYLFQVSTNTLVAGFPKKYMHPFAFGQGCSGIFNGVLQVISLGIGSSVKSSAMIYFVAGSTFLIVTLTLYIFSGYLPLYAYYLENNLSEERTQMLTKKEFIAVSNAIWPSSYIAGLMMMTLLTVHTAVTSLIVSDNYGHGYAWNDKFFVPAITFLYSDSCELVGRFLCRKGWITHTTKWYWVILITMRCLLFIPLLMLCNAHPRHHLPVWFPHDWQYILILTTFSVGSGFIWNVIFLSIPVLGPGKEETAFAVTSCVYAFAGAAFAPMSLLSVRLLL